jgi:hypothetical protein
LAALATPKSPEEAMTRFLRENYLYPGAWKVALAIVAIWLIAWAITAVIGQ